MKSISVALAAHFALPATTLAVCIAITRTDGTVVRITNHDANITFDGHDYLCADGGTATDVQASSALNVDNSEQTGIYGTITAADLKAGVYDYAAYSRFIVNYADTSMGRYRQQDGTLGQVTIDRQSFVAELRGLMQALQQSFGRVCTPTCPYTLGDSSCTKDLTTFTVTGTLESVSADGLTFTDSARTEAGPGGGIAITAITRANPCVVTTATTLTEAAGTAVVFSGCLGMTRINGVHVLENKVGSTFNIDAGLNTSDTAVWPAYTGSGFATPLGGTSGHYDYGLMTITSGLNIGRTREVKAYVPGQWTIQDAFPYAVAGTETYTLVAGCDKTTTTCIDKFSNLFNFGGFPFVPGQDSVQEVGHQQ